MAPKTLTDTRPTRYYSDLVRRRPLDHLRRHRRSFAARRASCRRRRAVREIGPAGRHVDRLRGRRTCGAGVERHRGSEVYAIRGSSDGASERRMDERRLVRHHRAVQLYESRRHRVHGLVVGQPASSPVGNTRRFSDHGGPNGQDEQAFNWKGRLFARTAWCGGQLSGQHGRECLSESDLRLGTSHRSARRDGPRRKIGTADRSAWHRRLELRWNPDGLWCDRPGSSGNQRRGRSNQDLVAAPTCISNASGTGAALEAQDLWLTLLSFLSRRPHSYADAVRWRRVLGKRADVRALRSLGVESKLVIY